MKILNNYTKKLSEGKKNVAKISLGTILGQVLSIITLPIITKIYGPGIIGLWTLFNSVSIIVNSFSDLGMSHSVMIANEKDVTRLYKVITTFVAFIALISASLFTVYYSFFTEVDLNLFFLFFYILFSIFTTKQIELNYIMLNRNKEYNILMKNPIINYGVFSITAIILGLLELKIYGYFIGYMMGQIATLLHMKNKLPGKMFTFNVNDFKYYVKKQRKFVIFQMPANVLSNIKNQMPTFLIRGLWGVEMVGYYSITVKVLQIPASFLATAIGRVFFSTASSMKREGREIGQYVINNMIKGMRIAIIPMILLMAFGDVAIIVFFGNEWATAGKLLRILALQYFFMFLTNTVQGLPTVLGKQNYAMISCLLQIVAYIVGAFLGEYIFHDIYVGLVLMSLFFIILNIAYYSALIKVMQMPIKKYLINVISTASLMLVASFLIRKIFKLLGIIDFIYKNFN